MAPRIPGNAMLKQPGENNVPEMAEGDTSPNHLNIKWAAALYFKRQNLPIIHIFIEISCIHVTLSTQ